MMTIVMIIITYLSVKEPDHHHHHLAEDDFTSFFGEAFKILSVPVDLVLAVLANAQSEIK